MAKFKIYLLTPDIETNSFFSTLLTDFDGQFTKYNNNKLKTDMWEWKSTIHSEQNNNHTFNEKFSIHTNSQKELSFDMSARRMINNEWKTNVFVSLLHVGSLILLEDKYNNHHVFVIKQVKTTLSDINTTYSYMCQDAFSYTLTRQNDGYSISNDPSSVDFIGAQTIDWWVNKIISECYIPDIYIKINECLFKNYYDNIIITQSPELIGDSIAVYKTANNSLAQETFSFSCDSSNALNALLNISELMGCSLVVKEVAVFKASRVLITRYFWFEPSKVDNISPYYYSPKKNIETFSFDQSGDSLTTVLNVTTHDLGDEKISLLPSATPAFLEWFQSTDWDSSKYAEGFFTNHLDGTLWTTEGDNPSLESVIELEGSIKSAQKAFINSEDDNNIWIPITNKDKGDWSLGYWDVKFQFSSPTQLSYFYIQEGEDESGIYSNQSFPCWLAIKNSTDEDYTIIQEHESIPQQFRGRGIEAYLVLKNIFNGSTSLSFYLPAELNIYSYQDISEADREFAKIADKIPWLENKIIDFKYFVNKGVLTEREYQLVMSDVLNKIRIINGKILCYASQYYNAIKSKTEILASLETSVESLHAELQAEGIVPFSESGASKDLKNFITKNSELVNLYSSQTPLFNANQIQNDYLNKCFKAEQRFLKNIYNFTKYFNSSTSSTEQRGYEYVFTFDIPISGQNYITFAPVNFESVVNNPAAHDRLDFYRKDGSQYKKITVVTQHNYHTFYTQRASSASYTSAADLKSHLYNKNDKYFLKKNTSGASSFISDVLKDIEPFSMNSNGRIVEYYPLNETQLKQYYFFKLYKSTLTEVKKNITTKTEIDYVQLPSGSDFTLDTVYLSKKWCSDNITNRNFKFPEGDYHSMAYINPNTEDFYGWHEKDPHATYPCPYGDNPFEFLKDVDPGIYLEQGYNNLRNHYKSASDLLTSKSLRYKETDKMCTYENYFKYRVATSNGINTEDGLEATIPLYTKNIRYVPVCVNNTTEPKEITLDKNFSYVIHQSTDNTSKLACNASFKPISLKETEISVQPGFSIYRYVDYGEKKLSEVESSKISEFYKSSVFFYNNSTFNPLIDSVTNNSIKYDFLDVCSDLYVVNASNISYAPAAKYKENNEVYFEQLSDKSYIVVPTYYEIINDPSVYIIGGQTFKFSEWNNLAVGEKDIALKVYLNQHVEAGTSTIDYPDLVTVSYNIKSSDIPVTTSSKKTLAKKKIKIKYANQVFESNLNCSLQLKTIIPANLTNGQYWDLYIKNSGSFSLCQEKALMIEQQLTEYWTQAYTASKYCNWFIPEHWARQKSLKENKFFFKLFSGSGSSLQLLHSFIPKVGIVSIGLENRLPSYCISYDPYLQHPEDGHHLSEVEYSNLAFQQFTTEILGSLKDMNKLRVKPDGTNTTYFYVEDGGCSWSNILSQIGQTQIEMKGFSGLYGMLFNLSKNFINNPSSYYERLLLEKESLWKELHRKYPNIFYEGVFEYPDATTSEELYQMAMYAFKGKSEPETNYSITVLDIYSLKGYSGEELRIGYPILVDVKEYQLDNLAAKKAIDQYLFITDISYDLRSDININITVNSIKYDDKLIQKLVKLIR